MNCISHKKLWNKGFVELWDFSDANESQTKREEAVALISGANYGKVISNPAKHYKRLLNENGDNASEVLGFIPAIRTINNEIDPEIKDDENAFNNYFRYGFMQNGKLFTNVRNVVNNGGIVFNEENLAYFVVVKVKIPYFIVDHMRRHGMLNHYFSENWQSFRSKQEIDHFDNNEVFVENRCLDVGMFPIEPTSVSIPRLRNGSKRIELINKSDYGVTYTTGWIAGWLQDPYTWQNMFKVRGSKDTQKEMAELCVEIKKMIEKYI